MLSIEQVSFCYGRQQPIFEDFSLEIPRGSLFGLLGPNGAGKTSLISLIAGLLKPQSGSIRIDGQSLDAQRTSILADLALVPQDYAFYPKLTARENLAFFSQLYSLKKQANRIERSVALTGLEECLDKPASSFSGGLKRRLNLAIGLLNEPSLLILDEPTVGIDPQSRRFILEAIQRLNKENVTVLYTSHYMDEIEQICTDVAILDQGRIMCQGTMTEILSNNRPLSIATDINFAEHKLPQTLAEFIKYNQIELRQNTLHSSDLNHQELIALIELLNQENIQVVQIKYGAEQLEDIFFNLTKTRLRDE